jgi:hypothetical protein
MEDTGTAVCNSADDVFNADVRFDDDVGEGNVDYCDDGLAAVDADGGVPWSEQVRTRVCGSSLTLFLTQ